MRPLVHIEPLRRRAFTRANFSPDLLVKNLGSTTRNRLHTCLFQQLQALLNRQTRLTNHIVQLHRRKCLDAHLGHNLLNAANHLGVVVEVAVGVDTTYNMHLGCTTRLAFSDLLQDLLHRVVPRPYLALTAAIRTETTLEKTDIGRLEMKVFIIKDLVATLALFGFGCQTRQQPQRSLLPQEFGFGGINTDTALKFLGNISDSHTISVLCDRDKWRLSHR